MYPYTVKINGRDVGFKPISNGSIHNYYSYDSSKTWDSNPFIFTIAEASNIYAYPQAGTSSDPYICTISSTIPSRITPGQTTQLVTKNHYAIGLSALSYVGNTKVISNLGDNVSASNGIGVPVIAANTYATSYSTSSAVQFFFNIFGQTLAGLTTSSTGVNVRGDLKYQLIRENTSGAPNHVYLVQNADPSRFIYDDWQSGENTFIKQMGTHSSNDIDICFFAGANNNVNSSMRYILRVWTEVSNVKSIVTEVTIKLDSVISGSGIRYVLISSNDYKSHPSYSNKYFLSPFYTSSNDYGNFPLYGEI